MMWNDGTLDSWKIKPVVFATGQHLATRLGRKRGIQVHLAQMFVALCSGFSRAMISRVNEQIARKGTAEILEYFLKHLILYFEKIPQTAVFGNWMLIS